MNPTTSLSLIHHNGAWRQGGPRFRGAAYVYVRDGELPEHADVAPDPLCKVKLFLTSSAWTYFAYALTPYDGIPVISGYCLSPQGPACDEDGDSSLEEIARLRSLGLPPERDLHWRPAPLSAIRAGDGR